MLFKFQIEETLSKEFLVEAQTEEEAEQLLRDKYKSEEIVLTADDFVSNQFISQGISYSDREPDFSTGPDEYPDIDDYSDEIIDDAELDKLGPDEPDEIEDLFEGENFSDIDDYSDLELVDDAELDKLGPDEPDDPELIDDGYSYLDLIDDDDFDDLDR